MTKDEFNSLELSVRHKSSELALALISADLLSNLLAKHDEATAKRDLVAIKEEIKQLKAKGVANQAAAEFLKTDPLLKQYLAVKLYQNYIYLS